MRYVLAALVIAVMAGLAVAMQPAMPTAVIAAAPATAPGRPPDIAAQPTASPPSRGKRPTLADVRALRDRLLPTGVRFRRGSWAQMHPEEGEQTFDDYARFTRRPSTDLTTIYVQPIGAFSDAQRGVLSEVERYLAMVFAREVKELPALGEEAIPARARRVHPAWGDHQILTTYVIERVLKPRKPRDALALLGLTATDLWPGGDWNFVFGEASFSAHVGVYSLHRYGRAEGTPAERRDFLVRMLKVATHETGHMLDLPHCTSFACVMNGSNSLPETDAQPLPFCPQCAAKLWWATGADPARQLRDLAAFAATHDLADEARAFQNGLRTVTTR